MSHIRRQDGPGRIFHVTSRVNWRAWHFEDDYAKTQLAEILAAAAAEFGIAIWAFVILSNHFHGVLQSPCESLYRRLTGRRTRCRHFRPWPPNHQKSTVLGQFMRVVRRTASVTRQAQLGLSGKFWETAYDARPVVDPLSLIFRIAYDHRNPTKIGLVQRPEQFAWSSANEWATGQPGLIPISLPATLPFDLTRDEVAAAVLRYQEERRLDDLGEHLKIALEDADPSVLRALLEEHGLADCGIDAAKGTRKS